MAKKPTRMVPINDDISIPVPMDASDEEEAMIVAKFKMENPPEKLAEELAELKQLIKDHEEGKTISFEQLIRELEEEFSKD